MVFITGYKWGWMNFKIDFGLISNCYCIPIIMFYMIFNERNFFILISVPKYRIFVSIREQVYVYCVIFIRIDFPLNVFFKLNGGKISAAEILY